MAVVVEIVRRPRPIPDRSCLRMIYSGSLGVLRVVVKQNQTFSHAKIRGLGKLCVSPVHYHYRRLQVWCWPRLKWEH